MTAEAHPDDRDKRLSPVIVGVLMCGAGLRTVTDLADAIGMNKGTLSRALNQVTAPSVTMVTAFSYRFPGIDVNLLVRPLGDPLLDPKLFGPWALSDEEEVPA